MTARELLELIDHKATLELQSLTLPVRILNARENFGRIDVLVTPEGGEGQLWVSSERVHVTA